MGVFTQTQKMDEKGASVYTGMSVKWLQQARWKGCGPKYYKIGRSVRYDIKDLDAYLASRLIDPKA